MLSSLDQGGYTIVATIQNTLAGALASRAPLTTIKSSLGTSLANELRSGQVVPRHVVLDFSPLLDLLKLPMLGGKDLLDPATGAVSVDTVLKTLVDPGMQSSSPIASDLAGSRAYAESGWRPCVHRSSEPSTPTAPWRS